MLVVEYDSGQGVSGTGYNLHTKTLVAWVKFKSIEKPKLVDMVKQKKRASILKTLKDTSPFEVATMKMHS